MSSNNGGVTTAKKLSKSKDEDGDIWEVGREIYKQADEARQDAVKQLFSVAEDIRGRAQETDGEARHRAHRVARNLEQAANYINGHTVDQIEETTEVCAITCGNYWGWSSWSGWWSV